MKIAAIIPARMGSSRFPGKPIQPILGRPMIEHVFRRTALCLEICETYIATCDDEIRSSAESFGAAVVMTSDRHERASDRVAEAAEKIDADVFVLVQGDEPMVTPESISSAVRPFSTDSALQCVNLKKRITDADEYRSPNTIKVVVNQLEDAIYMSRSMIPHVEKDWKTATAFKQVCIIPFTRAALRRYSQLDPTPLEKAESIDMLRFIEHGIPVRMIETDLESYAVDTPADLVRVEAAMKTDPNLSLFLD
jgi:3-deoxy-manno-octulosonate cytidylyltransferase (CMP-KDO synthetase)